MKSKIRVLVIDDSMVFREVLARGLASDSQIEIVAKAADPFEARDKILQYRPDVVTCDVEMPKMNGIEFIKRLLPQYPIPVIVVSSVSTAVFDAMDAGAVDFVGKPDIESSYTVKNFIVNLIIKIKEVHGARVIRTDEKIKKVEYKMKIDNKKIIAFGASTGGTEALTKVILSLPYNMPGIVIVQHIPPKFSRMFADRLNAQSHFEISEAVKINEKRIARNNDLKIEHASLKSPERIARKAKDELEKNNIHISPGLYPNGTEFLHSVRYIDVKDDKLVLVC